MNAMIKGSKLAHEMAFNLVYNNNNNETVESSSEDEVEFEINQDFVEFYKESLKYKLEKSIKLYFCFFLLFKWLFFK